MFAAAGLGTVPPRTPHPGWVRSSNLVLTRVPAVLVKSVEFGAFECAVNRAAAGVEFAGRRPCCCPGLRGGDGAATITLGEQGFQPILEY